MHVLFFWLKQYTKVYSYLLSQEQEEPLIETQTDALAEPPAEPPAEPLEEPPAESVRAPSTFLSPHCFQS